MGSGNKSGSGIARDDPQGEMVRLRLGYLLRDASLRMRRRFIQLARDAGLPLNQSEASTLIHVAHEPGLHQAALSAQLDIEPIALVRLLDTLEQAGLIERKLHKADRRLRTIWPTAAAGPVLAQIDAIRNQVREEAMAGLPDEARRQLVRSLGIIRANLE